MLRLEGFVVNTARSGEMGLEQVAADPPDAIILDWRMPLMDGLQFLRRLRATDRQRTTPVAIVTGEWTLDDATTAELRALEVEFVESAKVAPLAEAMVDVDRHAEHLKAAREAGWRAPADHPDLDPAHEALQLMEHLRELGRAGDSTKRPADFRGWLADGERAAGELRGVLAASPVNVRAAEGALGRVMRSCADCHGAYRD